MTATLPSWAGAGQRLLVVAPHPDDDVIGCGGTLFALVRSGVQPTIVYVTDGSASHPNSIKFPPPKLAALRKCEAREALRELGVRTKPIFLDVPDGTLSELDPSARSHVIERLADVIASLAIDTVFGPWRHDPHPDHVATASVLEDAVRSNASPPRSFQYVVWAEIRGDERDLESLFRQTAFECRLDCDQVDAKRRALLRHQSQTSALIDDDMQGFRIDEGLMNDWLRPVERFYAEA